jgi:hypothetical protein
MTPDPNVDLPAIVSPAQDIGDIIFSDRLTAIMAEAQAFGRKTVEQAVECGRRLLAAKAEIDARNAEIKKRKDKIQYAKVFKRFGFTQSTAWRLMRKAKNADSLFKMNNEMDAIYDDGQALPEESKKAAKLACRDCRHRGKKFSKACQACQVLNRPIPKPKDEKPLVDGDGKPVPDQLQAAWLDAQSILDWNKQLLDLSKSLKGLAERPGWKGVPVESICNAIKALTTTAWAYRPGFICADCEGHGFKKCKGDGYRANAIVRAERNFAKAEAWRARHATSQQPLPE